MERPISVVIPARDAEATLGLQLDALVAQLGPSDEVIVVDSGSTDATAGTVLQRAERDPRVRLTTSGASPGAGAARNVGVSVAQHALLAFLDADDLVGAGWLDVMRREVARHPYVAGHLEVERINPGWVVAIRGRPAREQPTFHGGLPFAHGCNMAVQRSAWETVGGMTEDLSLLAGEDIELALRLQASGVVCHHAPDAVVHYRYRSSGPALFRQAHAHHVVVPLLARKMEGSGFDGPPRWLDARKWVWLLVRLPQLRAEPGRSRWLYQAGIRIGLLHGSILHRRIVL